MAEFACKRDRDRMWEGSPWHVSKNAVILPEFEECMRPSELKFDKLQLWARVLNLPFNLRAEPWSTAIAHQIDKQASSVQFDHTVGYLRARVTVDVDKPLRRWILIESKRIKCMDPYDIVYENVPHFCFSYGKLGHSDLFCATPGTRDENGDLPFDQGLRAQDEWKKTASGEGSTRENSTSHKSKTETKNSSTAAKGTAEVTSPAKNTRNHQKRKGGPQVQNQMYRKVD